jgi:hypothetical protein
MWICSEPKSPDFEDLAEMLNQIETRGDVKNKKNDRIMYC